MSVSSRPVDRLAHRIAHDRIKTRGVAIAREFVPTQRLHTLMAAGATDGRLRDEVGLPVECRCDAMR